MIGFGFGGQEYVKNAKPAPGMVMDHALILTKSDLERLWDPRCIVQDQYVTKFEVVVPLDKGGLQGIKAYIPLLLFCEPDKPGAHLAKDTVLGITTGEDVPPKFFATVQQAPEELYSLRGPVEMILTIGGTKEKPVFGILKVKNFFYGFEVPGKLQGFCGEDKKTNPRTLPIPCTLGRRRTEAPKWREDVMAAAPAPAVITSAVNEVPVQHDYTVRTKFGLQAESLAAALKPIPAGMLTDARFNGARGFVFNLSAESEVALRAGMTLGFVQPPKEAPTTAIKMMGDMTVTKSPSQLVVVQTQGGLGGFPVTVTNIMSYLDDVVGASVGPRFVSQMTRPVAAPPAPKDGSVEAVLAASVAAGPLQDQYFAVTAPAAQPVPPALFAASVGQPRSFIIQVENPGIDGMHTSMAFILGKQHMFSAAVPAPIALNAGGTNFIKVTFGESAITAESLGAEPPGARKILRASGLFPNQGKIQAARQDAAHA